MKLEKKLEHSHKANRKKGNNSNHSGKSNKNRKIIEHIKETKIVERKKIDKLTRQTDRQIKERDGQKNEKTSQILEGDIFISNSF